MTTGEILAQLWFAEHSLRERFGTTERVITNVVMMGMGEPLQNYAALLPALRAMLDDHGYGLSRRRVTVSTSGVVPMMDRLALDCPVALAVSLHAANNALRDNLVPLNIKYPIEELLETCNRYLEHAPRDFITFEYCMLDGVNDQIIKRIQADQCQKAKQQIVKYVKNLIGSRQRFFLFFKYKEQP